MNKTKYIKFLKDYINFLEDHASEDNKINDLPFIPICDQIIYKKLQKMGSILKEQHFTNCPLNNSNDSIKLIVKKGEFEKGIVYIKEWIGDAKELTIVDRYFFKAISQNDEYSKAIKEIIKGIKNLKIFYEQGNNDVVESFIAENNNVRIRHFKTEEIHDRVLIKDNKKAIVVGASFNGLGKRLAFVLDMSCEDLIHFNSELKEIENQTLNK